MKKIISYFAGKHLFANFFFLAVLIGGVVFWGLIQKEELPDITLDFVRISVAYPGASAGEVEHFVTWPIEQELRSVNGLEEIRSTSSEGVCSIMVDLEKDTGDRATIVTDIRNAVLSVNLPDEIRDTPVIREFKSSRKAIIDVAVYLDDVEFLKDTDRKKLQRYTHSLENRLLGLEEINSISKTGYLKEELQVMLDPVKLARNRLPVGTVASTIRDASTRRPAGTLENIDKERITLDGEINSVRQMASLPVQGNFEGNIVRINRVADVRDTFEKNTSILKVNGREAVIMRVVKNSSYGILAAVDAVREEVTAFKQNVLTGSEVRVVILDDESAEVRNRISIIGSNGLIGFIFIISMLFIFLNFRTGFWVAMGIPFTFGFTLIVAGMMGYTINNMTLAAVIIVMGMIVDDAIIVAENIMRLIHEGKPVNEAIVEGTTYVMLPITASVLTTCAAFLPLLAFEGRLSMMTDVIPPVVSLMLLASLIESVIVLPAHIGMNVPRPVRIIFSLGTVLIVEKYYEKKMKNQKPGEAPREHWFHNIEYRYSGLLARVLRHRWWVAVFFIVFVVSAYWLVSTRMSFALFPREESTSVMLVIEAPEGTNRHETARLAGKAEKVFSPYLGNEVIGFRTRIGQTMFRAAARENMFMMRIELVDPDKREKSLKVLTKEWKEQLEKIATFKDVRFASHRFGAESGSPLEIVVIENDNSTRARMAEKLAKKLGGIPGCTSVEIGEPYHGPEYRLSMNRDLMKRIGVNAAEVGHTLRTIVEGSILYELIEGDEEKNVRLTIPDMGKTTISSVLNVPVVNDTGYLVPLREIVKVEKTKRPSEIQRIDHQRTVTVYSGLKQDAPYTPIQVADILERDVFPGLMSESPSTSFRFEGEVKNTRESSHFFPLAVALTILFIYIILALQFDSLYRPVTILLAIPPAAASVAFVFWLHGMEVFGFFGVIGVLGLSGVVVNDAIVLLKKLDDEFQHGKTREESDALIASISATRLRAVLLTTVTTVAGLFPTAYGIAGYDSMLAEMMLALSWGLIFGSVITLMLVPSIFSLEKQVVHYFNRDKGAD